MNAIPTIPPVDSTRDILLTRIFDAPRKLVWDAMTRPEQMAKWYGPIRVGGSYRVTMAEPEGNTYTCFGDYKEIADNERIVQTFVFDAPEARDHPALETLTFEQYGDTCVLNNHIAYDSQQSRDAQLSSGMESGTASSFDKLDAVLAGWKA